MIVMIPSICPCCLKHKAGLAACFAMIEGIPFNACEECTARGNFTQEELLRIGFATGWQQRGMKSNEALNALTHPICPHADFEDWDKVDPNDKHIC